MTSRYQQKLETLYNGTKSTNALGKKREKKSKKDAGNIEAGNIEAANINNYQP
jgi:hypothetical protein